MLSGSYKSPIKGSIGSVALPRSRHLDQLRQDQSDKLAAAAAPVQPDSSASAVGDRAHHSTCSGMGLTDPSVSGQGRRSSGTKAGAEVVTEWSEIRGHRDQSR